MTQGLLHPGSRADTLTFAGGGEWEGTFLGFDEEGVHWRRPDAKEPTATPAGNLVEARFDSHAPPSGSAPPAHSVLLANGDELTGAVVSLDDKTLLLDTWYAGRLAIPRAAVVGITTYNAGILYRGPDGPDGWMDKADNGDEKCWDYSRHGFVPTGRSDGAIGRDVGLPAMARIECDLAVHRGRQFGINIYSKGNDWMSGSYVFTFNQTGIGLYSIRLTHYTQPNLRLVGEPVALDIGALRGDQLHLDIRVNKDLKTIWLYADGKLLKQYIDPDEFTGAGGGIGFYTRGRMRILRVSNIKVTEWNGVTEDGKVAAAAKDDIIKMANHDKLSGKLKSIANGKAVFASSLSDVTIMAIPLDRMERIDFSTRAVKLAGSSCRRSSCFRRRWGDRDHANRIMGREARSQPPARISERLFSHRTPCRKCNFQPRRASSATEASAQPKMKTRAITLLPCALALAFFGHAEADDGPADTVTLLPVDKDAVLHGVFLGWDAEGAHWRDSGAKDASLFKAADLVEITLGSGKPPAGSGPPTALVRLCKRG